MIITWVMRCHTHTRRTAYVVSLSKTHTDLCTQRHWHRQMDMDTVGSHSCSHYTNHNASKQRWRQRLTNPNNNLLERRHTHALSMWNGKWKCVSVLPWLLTLHITAQRPPVIKTSYKSIHQFTLYIYIFINFFYFLSTVWNTLQSACTDR